jgi:hypothetical protein
MSTRSLKLAWASSEPVLGQIGVRVRFQTSEAVNMDPNVFAYLLRPLNPVTGLQAGYFDHVCNAVDLADYPIGAPLPAAKPPWFRLNFVDVTVADETIAQDFITNVVADVQALKAKLDLNDHLNRASYEIIGADPTPDVSSSLTL